MMNVSDPRSPEEKLKTACGLAECGMEMMRQKIRDRNPDISDRHVNTILRRQLRNRPLLWHDPSDRTSDENDA